MRIAFLLHPAVAIALIAAGCGAPAGQQSFSGIRPPDLRWLESADQDDRYVSLREVQERLGPGRDIPIETFDAVPLRDDWLQFPGISWKIWGDESADFILAGFDEKGALFRATGKVVR